MSRTLRVPIFSLPGAILFPRSQLPLHIFEPRYRDMVRDAIDGASATLLLEQTPVIEGALVAIDNHTGQVLAMVGGALRSSGLTGNASA